MDATSDETNTARTQPAEIVLSRTLLRAAPLHSSTRHGDLIPPLLSFMVERGIDPESVVLIEPSSREWAVGLNPLEAADDQSRFLQVTEITRSLADRWEFKVRTEELLRNALFVLSANGLTLLETALLLSDRWYRARLLKKVTNEDVREYFTLRYDPASEPMKATMREPVLNKLSELTADPHFRYILGQRHRPSRGKAARSADFAHRPRAELPAALPGAEDAAFDP